VSFYSKVLPTYCDNQRVQHFSTPVGVLEVKAVMPFDFFNNFSRILLSLSAYRIIRPLQLRCVDYHLAMDELHSAIVRAEGSAFSKAQY
jgi:hypothetical protein